ncbi:MAG: hypothetical protein ABI253_15875, partial [Mycobacterium sp.]
QSMVAHGPMWTHGAVHIDTQRLPITRQGDSRRGSAADTMALMGRAGYAVIAPDGREAWS